MRISAFLRNRVWGFRMIEVSAFVALLALALAVYLAKVAGAKDAQQITSIERQIGRERQQIRLLQAAVAKNEQPARIEQLSSAYLQLAPAGQKQEVEQGALVDIARPAKPTAPPAPAATEAGAR
jgi:hypothetical protein